jgi:translation initiation factor IF-3
MAFKNNFYISASSVLLLAEDGKPMGVMNPGKAKAIANDRDMPLVCVNPNANPPVYRLGNPPKDDLSTATVRLMGPDGEQFGVVSSAEARRMAESLGLDIIVVAPNQDPQVARLGDRGKYEYEQKKRKREMEKRNRAAAKAAEVKDLRFPCNGGDADRERIISQGDEFMEQGHPVNFCIRFPGRKVSHCDDVIERTKEEMGNSLTHGSIARITRNGNNFIISCMPKKS